LVEPQAGLLLVHAVALVTVFDQNRLNLPGKVDFDWLFAATSILNRAEASRNENRVASHASMASDRSSHGVRNPHCLPVMENVVLPLSH
jgi:hypothetical protein